MELERRGCRRGPRGGASHLREQPSRLGHAHLGQVGAARRGEHHAREQLQQLVEGRTAQVRVETLEVGLGLRGEQLRREQRQGQRWLVAREPSQREAELGRRAGGAGGAVREGEGGGDALLDKGGVLLLQRGQRAEEAAHLLDHLLHPPPAEGEEAGAPAVAAAPDLVERGAQLFFEQPIELRHLRQGGRGQQHAVSQSPLASGAPERSGPATDAGGRKGGAAPGRRASLAP